LAGDLAHRVAAVVVVSVLWDITRSIRCGHYETQASAPVTRRGSSMNHARIHYESDRCLLVQLRHPVQHHRGR